MTTDRGAQGTAQGEVVVGVDLGGTGTRVVVMSAAGHLLDHRTVATPTILEHETPGMFLARQIETALAGRPVAAIGIGASGPIDDHGMIRNLDTLPAFTGAPLVDELSATFSAPVRIENDAACAAVAESRIGAGRGADDLLHVTLGTGIGVALVVGGAPVRGADGTHPEAGHISVATPTPACYCGRRSCWEQGASRQALQHSAASRLGLRPDDHTAIELLAAQADAGDPAAKAVFAAYGAVLADGLATLLAVVRVSTVVLGGSASAHFRQFEPIVTAELAALSGWISTARLLPTELDDRGGAIGAALLALDV
ncbi:MAG: ROK family protein [Cellulomonas sp.]